MKKPDPKVALLRSVPALADQNDKELAHLAPLVDEITFEPGQVLMREGAAGGEAFLVVEGYADVSLRGDHLAEIGPGELAGEMALLDHSPRSATVTARTRMRVLVMTPASFSSILRQPTAGWRMAADLAARLRRLEKAPSYDLPRSRPTGGAR